MVVIRRACFDIVLFIWRGFVARYTLQYLLVFIFKQSIILALLAHTIQHTNSTLSKIPKASTQNPYTPTHAPS